MKIGKIPEIVLKRSVLNLISNEDDRLLVGPSFGEDASVIEIPTGVNLVTAVASRFYLQEEEIYLCFMEAINKIAAQGGIPYGILVNIVLDDTVREIVIKKTMSLLSGYCKSFGVSIIGGETSVRKEVSSCLLSITCLGTVKEHQFVMTRGAKKGQNLVVTKWIALEGSYLIAHKKESQLLERLPMSLIEEAKDYSAFLSILPEAASAVKSGVSAMHRLSEGGVFAALWELAESAGVGLKIDLKRLPIKQATVEICEYFDLNPYLLRSGGSLLLAADKGHDLVNKMQEQGIAACVIGEVTDGHDKIVTNGDEVRFLEKTNKDEYYKIV